MNYSAAKDSKQLAVSSNLDETEEDDSEMSESMSVSVSKSGNDGVSAYMKKLTEKYLGAGAAKGGDDDDSEGSYDSDDDDGLSDSAL